MTKSETGSEIFPTDRRGRVRVPRARREELLDEFEKSGLSGPDFAGTVGLKYQTFAFWRQQRQRRKPRMVLNSHDQPTSRLQTLNSSALSGHDSSMHKN